MPLEWLWRLGIKMDKDGYTIKEIESILKDYDSITMSEFQKSLGRFLFRFNDSGKMMICFSDVRNTISRILNARKSNEFKILFKENNIDWEEYVKNLGYSIKYTTDHNGCEVVNTQDVENLISRILNARKKINLIESQ